VARHGRHVRRALALRQGVPHPGLVAGLMRMNAYVKIGLVRFGTSRAGLRK
jgi:hypothetical protein